MLVEGKYSQDQISEEEKKATLNTKANNDPCEGNFASFTNILCSGGHIDLVSTADIGQTRYNKDMARDLSRLGTGRKSKEPDSKPHIGGIFHKLHDKLHNSLLALYQKRAGHARPSLAGKVRR